MNKTRRKQLSDIVDNLRDLMDELARRGYKGELTFTRIEKINIEIF